MQSGQGGGANTPSWLNATKSSDGGGDKSSATAAPSLAPKRNPFQSPATNDNNDNGTTDNIKINIMDESNTKNDQEESVDTSAFLRDVDKTQQLISTICTATSDIDALNQKSHTVTTSSEEEQISLELNSIIEKTNLVAASAKALLEKIKKEAGAHKKKKVATDAEIRMRDSMYASMTRKFMDAMKGYHKIQQKYKNDIKKKVRRQVQIVRPDASEEEVDSILRSTSDPSSIYTNAILQGTADGVKDAYVNCQDKYADVLRLEESVAELHQMFLDLALLVDQQGEMLDQIEFQVNSAANYVESGNKQLSKAIKHQSCMRKKNCFLLFFGLIVILVITLSVGAI